LGTGKSQDAFQLMSASVKKAKSQADQRTSVLARMADIFRFN
jgi:hypothetical protein